MQICLRPRKFGLIFFLGAFWAGLMLGACAQVPPVPSGFAPQAYKPVTYEQLLAAGPAGLRAGEKIRVPAYFWQLLTYDPAMVRNYLALAQHPLTWFRLEWFATYGTPDMKGYFDLAAMQPEQRRAFRLKRMEHIMIYGEMASMGGGLLYLEVHHIDRIESD
jgi:hypothetical protein